MKDSHSNSTWKSRVRVGSTVSLLTLTPSARQTDVGDHQIDASRQDVLLGNGVRSHYSSSQKVSSRRATPSARRRCRSLGEHALQHLIFRDGCLLIELLGYSRDGFQ